MAGYLGNLAKRGAQPISVPKRFPAAVKSATSSARIAKETNLAVTEANWGVSTSVTRNAGDADGRSKSQAELFQAKPLTAERPVHLETREVSVPRTRRTVQELHSASQKISSSSQPESIREKQVIRSESKSDAPHGPAANVGSVRSVETNPARLSGNVPQALPREAPIQTSGHMKRPPKIEFHVGQQKIPSAQTIPTQPQAVVMQKAPRVTFFDAQGKRDPKANNPSRGEAEKKNASIVPANVRGQERKPEVRQAMPSLTPSVAKSVARPEVEVKPPSRPMLPSAAPRIKADFSAASDFKANKTNAGNAAKQEGPRLTIGRLEIQIIQESSPVMAGNQKVGRESSVDVWEQLDRHHTRHLGVS